MGAMTMEQPMECYMRRAADAMRRANQASGEEKICHIEEAMMFVRLAFDCDPVLSMDHASTPSVVPTGL
jgi:hypothetical protein